MFYVFHPGMRGAWGKLVDRTTDGPPSHPLQAGVIPEALRRARYKFLGQKGGSAGRED